MPGDQSKVRLRLLDAASTGKVHELLVVPEVYHYLADGEPPPLSIAEQWCESAVPDWQDFGGGLWALVGPSPTAAKPKLLGLVQLADFVDGRAELTYLLHPEVWGQGWATRMAHSAMGLCFERTRVDCIWAGADAPNTASIAVLHRLGMSFARNVVYPAGPGVEYELSAADYVPKRFVRIAADAD